MAYTLDRDDTSSSGSTTTETITKQELLNLKQVVNKIKEYIDNLLNTEITDRTNADTSIQSNLTSHTNDTSNPHSVTKEQVGLGNVSNYFFDTSYSTSEPTEIKYATTHSCYHLYQDLNSKKQNTLVAKNGIWFGLNIGSTDENIGIYLATNDMYVY